ncbi:MAG: flagellar export protein FliJ [Sedimentisphaerales bacterium]|nr:flagellar export protein FliJ [Sedimentisphaerales bacterium]
MKKFEFRLQTVLKLRQQQEDQKKRVVGSFLAEINELQREAVEMAQAVSEQGQVLQRYINGDVDVNWITYYHGYVTNMRRSISEKIEEVARVQQKLIQARQELTEAARKTRILEKFKEKLMERHDRQLKKIEAREMDEIGNQLFQPSRNTA